MNKKRRNSWQPSRVLVLVANAGGIAAAKSLVRKFGGRKLYVPRGVLAPNHELVLGIGRPAAEALCREMGGERLVVPMGRDLKLDIAAEAVENSNGRARHAIVEALGVSYSTAKRILRKLKKEIPRDPSAPPPRRRDPRQIDLEDYL